VASRVSTPADQCCETGNTHARFNGCDIEWIQEAMPSVKNHLEYHPVVWLHRGAVAMDRRKYLWLEGLDSLYAPFYFEDVDLSYRAWKVGWKCLLAANSHVSHRHRLSIPSAGEGFLHLIVRRNQYIFFWKNINDLSMLAKHFVRSTRTRFRRARISAIGVGREMHSLLAALKCLPLILMKRLALARSVVRTDREVFELTAVDNEQLSVAPFRQQGLEASQGSHP